MDEMRLIDGARLERAIKMLDFYSARDKQIMIGLVQSSPTIDEILARYGQWKWADGYVGTTAECSVCGLSPMGFYSLPIDQIGRLPEYKYCPRCGARMGGDENGTD